MFSFIYLSLSGGKRVANEENVQFCICKKHSRGSSCEKTWWLTHRAVYRAGVLWETCLSLSLSQILLAEALCEMYPEQVLTTSTTTE